MSLRLVMMGTGAFALPTLLRLHDSSHEVVALVTQPDRSGRGRHHHINLMKEAALARGTDVFQPEKANAPESLERLRSYEADVFVVAAYGQILSRKLLAIPRLGAINLHASILPKYRGAAPIQHAVLHGETESGVSIFQIEPKLDSGPVLGIVRTAIGPRETSGELERRLAELAAPFAVNVIDQMEAGTAEPLPQAEAEVTLAPKIDKSMGEIDWSLPSHAIERHVRAMQPWPMPFSFLHSARPPLRLLILEVAPLNVDSLPPALPGAVVEAPRGRLYVRSGDGVIEVLRLQPAGKRVMEAKEFLLGHTVAPPNKFAGERGTSVPR